MRSMAYWPVAAVLLLASQFVIDGSAEAGIYSWTDESGHVHFSDTPVEGAKEHDSGSINAMPAPPMRIPFHQVGAGVMVVEGKVANIPMLFVVDTGASAIAIPPVIARQAGLALDGAPMVQMHTANGSVLAPLVEVDEVVVGDVRREHVKVVVQNIMDNRPVGLLGMNFLGAYQMTVDHAHSMLILEPR